ALFGTSSEPGFPQDSTHRRLERGLSNFDTRHRVVVDYVYKLPLNIQLTGIIALQSGRPFTVNRAIDQSGTGTFLIAPTDRPDQIADPFTPGPVPNNPDPACRRTVSSGGRAADVVLDPSSWFNPCAFSPAPGRFGT